jgi:ribosomal protein S27E
MSKLSKRAPPVWRVKPGRSAAAFAAAERTCIVRTQNAGLAVSKAHPTETNYDLWRRAHDLFNAHLFANRLPGCLITFQRRRNTYGFHAGSQFESSDGRTRADEIALNCRHFRTRPLREVLATFVHEMAHQYQWHFGKPSSRGYHNKQWARIMIDIGLVPSDTRKPGGKATGRRVGHFIRENGPFDRACTELLNAGFVIPFVETTPGEGVRKSEELRAQKAASKSRYSCPDCERPQHFWGKPGLEVLCKRCGAQFALDEPDRTQPLTEDE